MGYYFIIKDGFRVKAEGEYPWPWTGNKNRTIKLFTDDVLTKEAGGKYMKHTGLGCLNIILRDDQVEPIGKPVDLRLL